MAFCGLYNRPTYNEVIYNRFCTPERPFRVDAIARPVSFISDADPMLLAIPEGASVRRLLGTHRALEKRIRE